MKTNKIKNDIVRLLWEIPAVVIAVLLALGLNTLKENANEKTTAKESLKAIFEEVKENSESLDGFIKENMFYMDRLQKQRDSLSAGVAVNPDSIQIMYEHTLLSDAAWKTGLKKEINKFYGPEVTRGLAKIYNLQDLLNDVWIRQVDKITSMDFHRSKPDKAMINAHIELLEIAIDIARTYKLGEEQVLKDYQHMLK